MKQTKKTKTLSALLAVVVSLCVLLSIGLTAFAGDSSGDTSGNTYSITIANPTIGETYTAYKIFDVTYSLNGSSEDAGSGGTDTSYSYTISTASSWCEVIAEGLQNGGLKGLKLTKPENEDGGENDGEINYLVTFDSTTFSAANFAEYLAGRVTEEMKCDGGVGWREGSEGTCEIKLEKAGYYLVTCTGVHDGNGKTALAELTTTDPDVTINDKNNVTIDKKQSLDENGIDEEENSTYTDATKSVSVGDIVYFQITGEVPDTTGFGTYTYTVTDTLSEGLTLPDDDEDGVPDVTVKINGKVISKCSCEDCGSESCGSGGGCEDGCIVYYTLTGTEDEDGVMNGFVIKFYFKDSTFEVGSEIEITYSAKVNENAVSGTQDNSVTLTFSNDPTDSTSTDTSTDKTTVYTCEIGVYKFSGYEECGNLEEFEEGTTYYTYDDETGKYTETEDEECMAGKTYFTGIPLAGATFVLYRQGEDEKKEYYKWDSENEGIAWVEDIEGATTLTTGSDGTLTLNDGEVDFFGLEDGTYWLLETAAPDGYNMLTEGIKVEVAGQSVDEDGALVGEAYVYTENVVNLAGSKLPETGGMGTVIFYIVGGVLVLGAGVLLVVRLRVAKRESAAA